MIYTDQEQKLARLALNHASQPGEIDNASVMFFRSLRKRSIDAEVFISGSAGFAHEPRDRYSPPPRYNQPPPPRPRARANMSRDEARNFRMPFGKHKGMRLADIPLSYLRWLDSLDDLSFNLAQAVKIVINSYYDL